MFRGNLWQPFFFFTTNTANLSQEAFNQCYDYYGERSGHLGLSLHQTKALQCNLGEIDLAGDPNFTSKPNIFHQLAVVSYGPI